VNEEAAIRAAARVALATGSFAEPEEWWEPALADLVASFEPITDANGFEVDADVELDHLRWRIAGSLRMVSERAPGWFDHLGIDAGPVAMADVARVAGGAVGCWVDVSRDDLRSGWDVDVAGRVKTKHVLSVLPATPAMRTFASWCADQRVDVVHRVGVLAGGDGDCEITIALPGGNIDAQLASGFSLYERLEVERPPDRVLGILAAASRPRLLARVSLTPDGVASLGVGSIEPTTDAVLLLRSAVDRGDDESLAAFEGALLVTERERLDVVQQPGGPTLRLTYRID
jgi:hypothetical protein